MKNLKLLALAAVLSIALIATAYAATLNDPGVTGSLDLRIGNVAVNPGAADPLNGSYIVPTGSWGAENPGNLAFSAKGVYPGWAGTVSFNIANDNTIPVEVTVQAQSKNADLLVVNVVTPATTVTVPAGQSIPAQVTLSVPAGLTTATLPPGTGNIVSFTITVSALGASPSITGGGSGGSGGSGQPTGGNSPTVTPPEAPPATSNLPTGALLDRQNLSVFAGNGNQTNGVPDGMVYLDSAGPTVTIPVSTNAPDPNYRIQVYHWQPIPLPGTPFPGRWVALASTLVNGQAVAVNDGHYTGWFAAWWVVRPHFTDIAGTWAENDIRRMDGLGFVEGYPGPGDGLDRPFGYGRSITRAEFATIAARILGLNPPAHAYTAVSGLSWSDVENILRQHYTDWSDIPGWAAPYVAAMTKAGYVSGMDGRFEGDMPITRIQAGVIVSNILRAVGYTTPADLSRFRDAADLPDWAKSALVSGVLNGNQGLLMPNADITRAEATVVLLRLFRDLGF